MVIQWIKSNIFLGRPQSCNVIPPPLAGYFSGTCPVTKIVLAKNRTSVSRGNLQWVPISEMVDSLLSTVDINYRQLKPDKNDTLVTPVVKLLKADDAIRTARASQSVFIGTVPSLYCSIR